jgi:hypothetical protein
VFPTDRANQIHVVHLRDAQVCRVSLSSHHLFGIGGDQLRVMIDHAPILSEVQHAVEQRAVTGRVANTFADPHHDADW